MGKHSKRKLYFIFAAWTFLAVGIVAAGVSILRYESMRSQAEQDASEVVSRTILPHLEVGGDAALFATSAVPLLSSQLPAVRLWNAEGDLVGQAGAAQSAPVQQAALNSALNDGFSTHRAVAPDGEVLASYARLSSGAVLEIQQDYGPIARSIADAKDQLMLQSIASTALILVLIQSILWAATGGLRSEYERLLYLYRTGQAIRSTLDMAGVMEELARDAAIYTRAQVALTTLLDEETDELILKASYEKVANTSAQHHRKVEEWFLRRCTGMAEPVTARLDRVPYRSMLGHEPEHDGPAFILCIPIPGRERAIGAITVVRAAEYGRFRAIEVQMVEEMAAQGAMALEQALLFGKVRAYADEVELSYDGTLRALMAALDTKDSATQGHSERVTRLTVVLAKEMNVPQERLVDIERGALLHDVGKIGVPDAVLQKPSSLNDAEWEAMQKHPLLAGLMISNVGFLEGAMPILLYHHEHYDGTGYPFGLRGEAIPLEARIFTVVDAYDAMTSDRPYRAAMSTLLALGEIQSNSGIQFDPQVVEAFTRVINRQREQERKAA